MEDNRYKYVCDPKVVPLITKAEREEIDKMYNVAKKICHAVWSGEITKEDMTRKHSPEKE